MLREEVTLVTWPFSTAAGGSMYVCVLLIRCFEAGLGAVGEDAGIGSRTGGGSELPAATGPPGARGSGQARDEAHEALWRVSQGEEASNCPAEVSWSGTSRRK